MTQNSPLWQQKTVTHPPDWLRLSVMESNLVLIGFFFDYKCHRNYINWD